MRCQSLTAQRSTHNNRMENKSTVNTDLETHVIAVVFKARIVKRILLGTKYPMVPASCVCAPLLGHNLTQEAFIQL